MGNGPMRIDWQTYYEAARKCHELATDLRAADKPVHDAVKGPCAGMAGDAPGCKQWGEAYDTAARETMQACTNLADALTNYGYVLYSIGYNYGIAAKTNPPPPRPDVRSMNEHKVTIPTSVRDNGIGIDHHDGGVKELFDALVAQILQQFGKLPNGDVDKLATASQVWKAFAGHETITGAAGRISTIIGLFDSTKDPTNLPAVLERLDTLRDGATQLAAATQNLAAPVADYHAGTVAVRADVSREITNTEWAIGITVIAGAAAAFFTWGASAAAAGGGVTVMVANCINAIRTAYQGSNLIKAVGLAAAAAGAIGTIKAFDNIPDLGGTLTGLAEIIAMKVLIDDDGSESGADTEGEASSGPTTSADVREILLARTQPGKNKPNRQMSTEEEIRDLYEDLTVNGKPSEMPHYDGQVKELPDGTKIGIRDDSRSGGVTIDIRAPGEKPRKVHLP